MTKKALFPGTFDPITNGHLDLIMRSLRLFDEVIIGVAAHTTGKQPHFPFEKRLTLVQAAVQSLPHVVVKGFSGLLIDFYRQETAQAIIRGVRGEKDFDYEFQMAQINHQLLPEVETLFMPASSAHLFMSASMVRELAKLGAEIDAFVPAVVAEAFKK